MTTSSTITRTGAGIAALLVVGWLFWPAALGGSTTYVTTHGVSMEPQFSTGDLAILRPTDRYVVGDVVAFRSDELDTTVMHRIVARDGHRFVTQGDSNTWLDPEEPTADEILGELFLSIPQGGTALAALRSPWALAAIALAVTTVVGAARRPRGRHSARHARRRSLPRLPRLGFPRRTSVAAPRTGSLPTPVRASARRVSAGAAVAALLAAAAAAATYLLPSASASGDGVDVLQQGTFAYTGTAAPGTTYPTGALSTGDPVYTRLVDDLTVSFEDVVTGAAVAGTVRLDVAVEAPDGWTALISSGAPAPVQDGTATAAVVVDHARATELLRSHHDEVGAVGTGAAVTVTPVVELTATGDGVAATLDQPAGLRFTLDATALRLDGEETALSPAVTTTLPAPGGAGAELDVAGVGVPLAPARLAIAVVLALAVATAAAAGLLGRGRGEADGFLVRHAARVLPVSAFAPGGTVIDVTGAEALHRLAERLDVLVLHHAGPHADTFAVQDGDTTYRCVVPRVGAAHPAAARPAAGGLLRRFA